MRREKKRNSPRSWSWNRRPIHLTNRPIKVRAGTDLRNPHNDDTHQKEKKPFLFFFYTFIPLLCFCLYQRILTRNEKEKWKESLRWSYSLYIQSWGSTAFTLSNESKGEGGLLFDANRSFALILTSSGGLTITQTDTQLHRRASLSLYLSLVVVVAASFFFFQVPPSASAHHGIDPPRSWRRSISPSIRNK